MLALLVPITLARPPTPADTAALAYEGFVERMEAAAARFTDASFTFHKNEWVSGAMTGEHVITVHYRKPGSIYMKWVGDISKGRELLFGPGFNDGKLLVSTGKYTPTVSVHPQGRLAMADTRHMVPELGLHTIIRKYRSDINALHKDPAYTADVTDLGEQLRQGEKARCFHSRQPKDRLPTLWSYETETCFSLRTDLFVHIRSWDLADGSVRLVEDYGYANMQLDPGLGDPVFSPENPDYNF